MKIKVAGTAVDHEGNEQPVTLWFDVGGYSATGLRLEGTCSDSMFDDIATFEMTVAAPFKPSPTWDHALMSSGPSEQTGEDK